MVCITREEKEDWICCTMFSPLSKSANSLTAKSFARILTIQALPKPRRPAVPKRPLRSKYLHQSPLPLYAFPAALENPLTISNDYMKVQLAKIKADNEKSGKKNDHKVSPVKCRVSSTILTLQANFKAVAETWKTA